MIIWGSTGKEKRVGEGDFYCPQCRAMTPYQHRSVMRYFTLYFIPLFPMQTLGEYVECRDCGGTYDTQILDLTAADIESAMRPWTCPDCNNSNPPGEETCLRCNAPRDELEYLD